MAMPVKARTIWKSINSVSRELAGGFRVLVMGEQQAGKTSMVQLLQPRCEPEDLLEWGVPAAGRAASEARKLVDALRPDLVVYVAAVGRLPQPGSREAMDELRRRRIPVVVVVNKADLIDGLENALKRGSESLGVDADAIIPVSAREVVGVKELTHAVLGRVHESKWLALGTSFKLFRPEIARRLISKTARQNGIVAALGFTPGADIAVLTANQIKLILELGGLYGHRVSPRMGKEIAATVGAGLGMRALARQVLGLVPVGGWAAKGAMAYAGTMAIGQAAIEYFSRKPSGEGGKASATTLATGVGK